MHSKPYYTPKFLMQDLWFTLYSSFTKECLKAKYGTTWSIYEYNAPMSKSLLANIVSAAGQIVVKLSREQEYRGRMELIVLLTY